MTNASIVAIVSLVFYLLELKLLNRSLGGLGVDRQTKAQLSRDFLRERLLYNEVAVSDLAYFLKYLSQELLMMIKKMDVECRG